MPPFLFEQALVGYRAILGLDLLDVFSNAMLMFVPGGIVVLATPFFVDGLARAERRIIPSIFLWTKVFCGLGLIAVQATNVVLWQSTKSFYSDLCETASIMSLLSSLGCLAIVIYAQAHALRTPDFLGLFLSLTTLFDVTMAWSGPGRDSSTPTAVQIWIVLLKIIFATAEEIPNRLPYHSQLQHGPNIWNAALLLWLNPLFIFGWLNQFSIDDLPSLGDQLSPEKLSGRFYLHWNKVDKSSSFNLVVAILRTLKWQFAMIILSRLGVVGCSIAQPFLLFHTVEAITTGPIDREVSDTLVGTCVVVFFGISVMKSIHNYWSHRVIVSIRGILVAAIYDKAQRLPAEDHECPESLALIKTGVDGVEDFVSLVYALFSSLTQLAPSIWALYEFIGPAAFLIILPALGTSYASISVNKIIAARTTGHCDTSNSRIIVTSNIFAQLRSVKAMGLSNAFSNYLETKCDIELDALLRKGHSVLLIFGVNAINYTVIPAVAFAGAVFWTRASNPISVAEVFATFAVLLIATEPLVELVPLISGNSGSSFQSVTNVQAFLAKDELRDPRDVARQHGQTAGARPQQRRFAIELEDVSVSSQTGNPLLQRISLHIPWGALAMMWGPIGCGKSTFLKLLLGEVESDAGTISVGSEKISYCSQEFWITNCSVRSVIIGGQEYLDSRYDAVVRACELDVDFASWPDGDSTVAGAGGCNLSVNQRQRIGLARAVYAENEIMVLDDMFRHLDPDTAGRIFQTLFGPNGMVKRRNCTVIMVTNRLELLDFSNHVYQFTHDGHIEKQEDFSSDGSSCFDSSTESSADSLATDVTHVEDSEPPLAELPEEKELPKRRCDGKAADVSLYASFVRPVGALVIVLWFIVAMTAALGEWIPAIYLRLWLAKDPSNPQLFVGYGFFSCLSVVLNMASGAYFNYFICPNLFREIHRRLLGAVLGATPGFLNEADSGSLLSRFTQDLDIASENIGSLSQQAIYEIFTVLIEILLISFGCSHVQAICTLLFLSFCIVESFYIRSSRQLQQLETGASSALNSHITEANDGMHHIRAFGWQSQFRQMLYSELDRSQRPRYLLWSVDRWVRFSMGMISAVAGVFVVRDATSPTEGLSDVAVGLSMLCLIGFSATTTRYIRKFAKFIASLGIIRRMQVFIKSTPQEQDLIEGPELPSMWPTHGRIDFGAVTVTYEPKNGPPHRTLNNFTFTIREGQRVGIMGRSGSGKSSLLLSALRMVDYSGTISIDGRNIQGVRAEFLRSRITTITQEGLRLKSTLRFNMYPYEGPQPSEDDIIAALRAVSIWPYVVTNGGLDVQYSQMRFSVSQRQLIFVARAMLHQSVTRSRIVLIDEATTAVSPDAEEEIQELVDRSFDGCTVLMVSHTLESLRRADVILRLESGTLDKVLRRRANGQLVEVH